MSASPPTPSDPASAVRADASELRMATFKLARRLRAERAVDSVSDGQYAVLSHLTHFGPHTLSELAERERVSPPSMNRTINCLEEQGYIARSADETDRRKTIITATESATAIVYETKRRRDAWLETAEATLTSEERDILQQAATIMQKLVAL